MSLTTYISMTFVLNDNNSSLQLPLINFSGKIDWGNRVVDYESDISSPSNLYANSGTYIVKLQNVASLASFGDSSTGGDISLYRNSLTSFSYLVQIPNLTVMTSAFFGCTQNFTINFASGVTSNILSMSFMFRNTTQFNRPITIDTSTVQNMTGMFLSASSFNQPINFDCSANFFYESYFFFSVS